MEEKYFITRDLPEGTNVETVIKFPDGTEVKTKSVVVAVMDANDEKGVAIYALGSPPPLTALVIAAHYLEKTLKFMGEKRSESLHPILGLAEALEAKNLEKQLEKEE